MKNLAIGIDPGVNTGVAVWNTVLKQFKIIQTMPIHQAMKYIEKNQNYIAEVIVEDARKATYGRHTMLDASARQGAGSIKRDCKIWDDYLLYLGAPYRMFRPDKTRNSYASWGKRSKLNKDQKAAILTRWRKMTGWNRRCSELARVASMLVLDYKPNTRIIYSKV